MEDYAYNVYVKKRPGVDEFLKRMSEIYEVVIYTASMSKYAIPVIKQLDPNHHCSYHLFRNHCSQLSNTFVKDLSLLGRDLANVIIIDNCPNSYMLQPDNALPIDTWTGDLSDNKLTELIPILEMLSTVNDVRGYIKQLAKRYEKFHTYNKVEPKKSQLPTTQLAFRLHSRPESIRLSLNKGVINSPKPNTILARTHYNSANFGAKIIPFINNKPVNLQSENLDAIVNQQHLLEYRIMSATPTIGDKKFKDELKTIKKASIYRNSMNTNEDFYKKTDLAPIINKSDEIQKPFEVYKVDNNEIKHPRQRTWTTQTSSKEIMCKTKHAGVLIKQTTIRSPVYLISKKNDAMGTKIRYQLASAYDVFK